jgi:dipeptidyl aminopeptidase/acylaminoacyl peptidase
VEAVSGLGPNVGDLTATKNRLLFQQRKFFTYNLWKLPVLAGAAVKPERLMVSSFTDRNADFSPDGRRVVFSSDRGGASNIWLCNADGSDPVQLTFFEEHTGTPRWSPDGRTILFDSLHSGNGDLWVIDREGGTPRQLTSDPTDEVMGTWSRDGKWIYFSSTRSGRSEIYRIPSEGGEAVPITHSGGWYALESKDGKDLYYSKNYELGIFRVSLSFPNQEEVVVREVRPRRSFSPGINGLYFADQATDFPIRFLDFNTGRTSLLFETKGPFSRAELTVSPDEKWMLFNEVPSPEAELMLVENFH